MNLLITGGAGFIGSHTIFKLLAAKKSIYNLTIIDNLSNSTYENLHKIELFTNKKINFIKCDIKNKSQLKKIFTDHNFDGVIHYAGLKSVPKSFLCQDEYYENNVIGSKNLFDMMIENNIKNIVFSSSASIYGFNSTSPIKENQLASPLSPYASNKLEIEQILRILSDKYDLNAIVLRYFNPIGAYPDVPISDSLSDYNNTSVVSNIYKVLVGAQPNFILYGQDYQTPDGTCIRDYIHIDDLVNAHLKSLEYLMSKKGNGFIALNIGTGNGYSVLELIKEFELVTNKKIPILVNERRDGDPPSIYADSSKAKKLLNWETSKNLNKMCTDVINFINKNGKKI